MATPVPQKDDVERWTVEQVAAWLQQVELSDCCDSFLRRGIDGHRFLQLSEGDLFQWGSDVSFRNRTKILKLVSQIKSLQQHLSTTRQPNEVLRYLGSQPRGQEMQLGQMENVQDECGEDLYLQLLPDSPTDKHPNMLDNLSQPPLGRPLPPKTLSNGHHRREGPGSLNPPNKTMPSYRPSNESGGLNNGMKYVPHNPRRIQKGPLPLPEQSASQNKAPATPPIPPRTTVQDSSNKAACSTFPRTNSRQNNIHGPGSGSLETHNNDFLDGSGDSCFDGEETEKHSSQRIQPGEGNVQGDGGIDSLYLEPLKSSATNPSQNNVRNSAPPPIPDRIPKRPPPPTPDALAAPLNKQRPATKNQAVTPRVPTHPPLQGSSSLGLTKSGSNGGQGGLFPHGQFASNTIPTWRTNKQSSPAPLSTQSSEPNDHEYETVDASAVPYWSNETPGPNMADSDDRDPSSRLGPAPLPPGKLPQAPLPPPTRSLHEGQSTQARPPDLPSRADQNRQHKAPPAFFGASSHPSKAPPSFGGASDKIFPPPSNSLRPSKPTVSLGKGNPIEVTPLLQTVMDKPYFQFISRAKAKELVLQGGEGTFIIRPSTRTENPLTITVKHNERSFNINIRQRPDGRFALGNEKASEKTFSSIDEIVSTHYKEPITLEKGETALLKFSPSKPNKSVYVQHVPGR